MTYFQLVTMAEAHLMQSWDHTAAITATLINCHRKKGSSVVTPEQLHPLKAAPAKHRLTRENVHMLKALAGRVEDG